MNKFLNILKNRMVIVGILVAVALSSLILFQSHTQKRPIIAPVSDNNMPPKRPPVVNDGSDPSPLAIDEESNYAITPDMLSNYVKMGAIRFSKKDPTSEFAFPLPFPVPTSAPIPEPTPDDGIQVTPAPSISIENVKIIAQKYSAEQNIDIKWILAVIKVSTNYLANFVEDDKNNTKDVGLMRINTESGKYYANKLGITYQGQKTLLDPDHNIAIGTACLKEISNKNKDLNYIFTYYHDGEIATQALYDKNKTYESVFSKQVIDAIQSMGGTK
jgi:hypothetical protein